jgi:SAM-dependent methyltransferase
MTEGDNAGARHRARQQYASVGDAYVRSAGHATGSDLERMVRLAAPADSDVLLDLATGGGHVAGAFAPHVATVIASDLTPEMLVHARRHLQDLGWQHVAYLVADAGAIPLRDASCDIVTCRIAPHHFPDPAHFVAESARVLRPGGRFVLVDRTVPDGQAGDFFNRFEMLRDPSHVRSLTMGEWQALIVDAGLTLTVAEPFRKRHDFDDWATRSRVSPAVRTDLELLAARTDPAITAPFALEWASTSNSRLVAFSDTKTLFLASKPVRLQHGDVTPDLPTQT